MKNNKINIGVLVLILSIFVASESFAQGNAVSTSAKLQNETKVKVDKKVTLETETEVDASAEAETEAEEEAEETKEKKEKKVNEVSASHRSAVATFVQELLRAADREKGGIGAEVRVIAQEQEKTNEEITEATVEVENRSKIKTFLFGSDYKNLGTLRSAMVKTDSQVAKLEALLAKATDATAKATLTAQIDVLKKEQEKITEFIEEKEATFSLFGWLFKKD